jgi:hypothetical protein
VLNQLMVKRAIQPMVLIVNASSRHARWDLWIVKNRREIQPARLPVIHGLLGLNHVNAADHLVDSAETQLCHVLADLLRDEEEEIDHVLGLTLKLLAQ